MKKIVLSLALAVFLFAVVGLAGGIGVASAHDAPAFGDTVADAPSPSPVGKHLRPPDAPGHPGAVNGLENENTSALDGLDHNPNCPRHYPH